MEVTFTQALDLLKRGHVVAIPTETVYGLAASLEHPHAIEEIYRLKKRPSNNPLIIHIHDIHQISQFCDGLPPLFNELAINFWPGPLSLVIPIKMDKIPSTARAGLPTAAFRIPSHPITREIIRQSTPLVMPSANLSGRPSATHASHLREDFGVSLPYLDGGVCDKGVESTILVYKDSQWQLGRLGAIPLSKLENLLGYSIKQLGDMSKPLCPGQHYRHYSPKAVLKMTKKIPNTTEGVILGFSDRVYPMRAIYLSHSQNGDEAAHQLYAALRQLDAENIEEAWIDGNFPTDGLWETVYERLIRACLKPHSIQGH